MEDRPTRDPRILEALESCRPGTDDLSDPAMERLAAEMAASPELDDLYERLQRLDASLAAAFHDVPVPEGLEERILARLESAQAQQPAAVSDGAPKSPSTVVAGRRTRRRLLWVVAAATVAAALLMAFWLSRWPTDLGDSIDWNLAIDRFRADLAEGLHGHGQSIDTAPSSHPFSPAVLASSGATWRPVRSFLGCKGVAYDLIDPNGVRASLYVVRATASVPDAPDLYPAYATGNRSVAMWREGGLLYTLAVDGGEREYQRFLNFSTGPVA